VAVPSAGETNHACQDAADADLEAGLVSPELSAGPVVAIRVKASTTGVTALPSLVIRPTSQRLRWTWAGDELPTHAWQPACSVNQVASLDTLPTSKRRRCTSLVTYSVALTAARPLCTTQVGTCLDRRRVDVG
jgi:hypothetical protein